MNLFDWNKEPIKLTGKIRLFEVFAGIGSQAEALKRVTSNYELVGISEIDKFAIKSYQALHGDVKNYGDIRVMKEIPECDIFTYSFPCQDITIVGRLKGINEHTRSGLVYEVLRLLKSTKIKPTVLLMENVPMLVSKRFIGEFNNIFDELQGLGYSNYWKVLNALDYGIPQKRKRVFMISVLGEYYYEFPEPVKRKLMLKDMLEQDVDSKYFLSERNINTICDTKRGSFGNGFKPHGKDSEYAFTITIRQRNCPTDNYILYPCSNTLLTDGKAGVILKDNEVFYIRRLTPLECFKLMGFKDIDYMKIKEVGISETQMYKQAGNSIVVDVLEAIFRGMIE